MHKWLALFIGAQLLIWFASGTLMSFLPIEKVRGEHLVDREQSQSLPQGLTFADPAMLVGLAGTPVEAINWHMLGDRPVAELETAEGAQLFDAVTGEALPAIDAEQAKTLAMKAWRAATKPLATVTRVTGESAEYRGDLPAWRVAFADPDNTVVYVAAGNGRIAAVRTGTWRLYDFFWGLHIMDWKNHENFNTPWLLGFALGGLLLGIFGTILLFMRWPFRRRRART
jgi:hypothetical protein